MIQACLGRDLFDDEPPTQDDVLSKKELFNVEPPTQDGVLSKEEQPQLMTEFSLMTELLGASDKLYQICDKKSLAGKKLMQKDGTLGPAWTPAAPDPSFYLPLETS